MRNAKSTNYKMYSKRMEKYLETITPFVPIRILFGSPNIHGQESDP
jgi:hypothetical protein